MNKIYTDYLRQVGQAMSCPRREQKRLLSGFTRELEDAFPPEAAPTMADLTARFGSPGAMAAELQSALPEHAAADYQKGRRKKWMIATAACAAVIALLIGYLIWLGSNDVYIPPQNERITYETHYIVED